MRKAQPKRAQAAAAITTATGDIPGRNRADPGQRAPDHSSEVQVAHPQITRRGARRIANVSKAGSISRYGRIALSVHASRRGRGWRRRVRAAGLARRGLAGRKSAVLLGRTAVLLVSFGLARPRLVPVRLCVPAWLRLGRPRRLAWLAPAGLRPPACRPPWPWHEGRRQARTARSQSPRRQSWRSAPPALTALPRQDAAGDWVEGDWRCGRFVDQRGCARRRSSRAAYIT